MVDRDVEANPSRVQLEENSTRMQLKYELEISEKTFNQKLMRNCSIKCVKIKVEISCVFLVFMLSNVLMTWNEFCTVQIFLVIE